MYVDQVIVTRGSKILWEGSIQEASFGVLYEGVDGSWDEAQRRAVGIGDQCVNDWIAEMSQRGRIEFISPLHISLFDRSEEEETILRHVLKNEAPKIIKREMEGSLMRDAVKLTFDATGSQGRAVRILRAYEEPYSFIHQENGDWTCLNKEGRAYRLYIDLERSTGCCTCQDFQQRGISQKMPCKHLYGYVVQTQKIDRNRDPLSPNKENL